MSPRFATALGVLITGVACLPQSKPLPQAQPSGPQQPPAATPAKAAATQSTDLHRAWLLEVLDLDPVAASTRYAEIAADDRPGHFTRWIAAARLTELLHLDAVRGSRPDLHDVPESLRTDFEELDSTRDKTALLRRVTGDAKEVLDRVASADGKLPPLRPLVWGAEVYVVDQIGPNRLDRIKRSRRLRDMTRRRTPFVSMWYAHQVLRAELEGETEKAESRRSIHFRQWQAPPVDEDQAETLRRVRKNLESLINGREWSGSWLSHHRRLQAEIERQAAADPTAAINLVRRLPYYAERLLAPVPEAER